jgi:hypothetical protein
VETHERISGKRYKTYRKAVPEVSADALRGVVHEAQHRYSPSACVAGLHGAGACIPSTELVTVLGPHVAKGSVLVRKSQLEREARAPKHKVDVAEDQLQDSPGDDKLRHVGSVHAIKAVSPDDAFLQA